MSRLTDAIAGREAVLVLDNCEHVIDAAAALAARVLQECPDRCEAQFQRNRGRCKIVRHSRSNRVHSLLRFSLLGSLIRHATTLDTILAPPENRLQPT